jgi:hypothetical protein
MQILRTILIIILIYYLAKLFARYVLPLLARYFIRRSQKAYQKQHQQPKRKVGDMNIEYEPEKTKTKDDLGEYVDYEEIKDSNKNS